MSYKTVGASLHIELNVDCPYCEHFFDLLTDTDLNDEGCLLGDLISDRAWKLPSEERLDYDEVFCPKCEGEFSVKGVEW